MIKPTTHVNIIAKKDNIEIMKKVSAHMLELFGELDLTNVERTKGNNGEDIFIVKDSHDREILRFTDTNSDTATITITKKR